MKLPNLNRRSFLGMFGTLGALALTGCSTMGERPNVDVDAATELPQSGMGSPVEATVDVETGEVTPNEEVLVRYSGCVGCYSSCGNRIKLDRATGLMIGAGGNPYNPAAANPYLPFEASLDEAFRSMSYVAGGSAKLHGTICGRGKAVFDAISQPGRVTAPLKRAGKRGEGKWKPISWDQLITEVVEGGKLFEEIGESQEIEGFRAVHDTVTPIDAEQPDLGPKSNQLVMIGMRADGRWGFKNRFASTYGTTNSYSHSSSCGAAIGTITMYQEGGLTVPDLDECEYVIWSGAFPGANGTNYQYLAKHTAKLLHEKGIQVDILDPSLGNGVVTPTMPGVNWIPIKPATNGAFYSALAQYIIAENGYDAKALSFANQTAAEKEGYGGYTNASYLVIDDENHPKYRMLLRAEDAGLDAAAEDDEQIFVVVNAETGAPCAHVACDRGDIEYEGEVNGIKVRTGWRITKDSINEHTIDEYAEITGVPVAEIERMAKEYIAHGRKSNIQVSAGATATVVGADVYMGRLLLCAMAGNLQVRGGSWPVMSAPPLEAPGQRYDLAIVEGAPDVTLANATMIARGGKSWSQTDEYKNRIAAGESDPKPQLPWYSFGPLSDSQALMSIVNAYPYQCKIFVSWMANTLQGTPGAMRDEVIEKLKDPQVVPLSIVCDIVIGEMAQYADYIVPDVTQYESFGNPDVWQTGGFGATFRWEAKTPESIQLDDGRYACWENFLTDVAKACELPGWGDSAIPGPDGNMWPLNSVYDYYMKSAANLAYFEEPVEDITEDEKHIQGLDLLPAAMEQAVLPEDWPKVLKVMSRGGRHWAPDYMRSDTDLVKNATPFLAYVYSEPRALAENSYSSNRLRPVLGYNPQSFADLNPLTDRFSEEEFPFTCSEHKPRFRSISMLSNSPIMRDVCDHNYLEMNDADAADLGIADGDKVRATTPTGETVEVEVMVRAGQARGAFSMAFGYGHKNYGAQDVDIDGEVTKGDPAIAQGARIVQMLDPVVAENGGMGIFADNYAASPGRCGGMFKIEKA